MNAIVISIIVIICLYSIVIIIIIIIIIISIVIVSRIIIIMYSEVPGSPRTVSSRHVCACVGSSLSLLTLHTSRAPSLSYLELCCMIVWSDVLCYNMVCCMLQFSRLDRNSQAALLDTGVCTLILHTLLVKPS